VQGRISGVLRRIVFHRRTPGAYIPLAGDVRLYRSVYILKGMQVDFVIP
jgi:hypothetical protein